MKNLVKEARTKKAMSQQSLADKAGITREYISMIESGERTPKVHIAKKIASVLGIDWTRFFEDTTN